MLSAASPVLAAESEEAPPPRTLIPLNFSSQDAFAKVPPKPRTNTVRTREFRAVSASGRHYVASCQFVSPAGETLRGGGGFSVVNEHGNAYAPYRVVVLRFIPAERLLQPAPILVDLRLNDGQEGHILLNRHAVKFPESNWTFPPDAGEELKQLEGTAYVFKYDESDTSPLTFHLP